VELTNEQIAQICHETNRAYCSVLGDNSQPSWADAPEWQRSSAVDGVHHHLAIIEEGGTPDPADSHKNWLIQKEKDGWKYGPVKDPEKKEHPCFVPYEDLPVEQRIKDWLFIGVVKAVFEGSFA
jgi:hypothetical protein